MGIFDKKCSKGHANSSEARFCSSCGETLAGGEITCGGCGTQNRGDARFCKKCGRPLSESASPEIRGNHWSRHGEDFAVRVDASDLQGLFKRGIIVEPGTNAMLVDGGATMGMLAPGTHNLDSLDKRLGDWLRTGIGSQVTALLVDVTPADLEFAAGGVFTKDSIRIGVRVRLQTQVQDAGRFLVNLLRGRERLSRLELEGYLYPEVSQVLEAWVGQHSVQELAEDLSLRPQLELALDEALKSIFKQSGLQFINVRAAELNLEHLDHIKGIRSNYTLQIMEKEADNQGKKSLFEVIRAGQLQQWVEEAARVEDEERRVELYARMQKAVLAGKMNEVRTEAEFAVFLDEMGAKKLLREKEHDELMRTWKESAEDHDLQRSFMLEKLHIEQEYQVKKSRLISQGDLDHTQLEIEIDLVRKRADFEMEQKRKVFDEELYLERERQRIADERKKAEIEMKHLQEQQELADDMAAAEYGLKLLAEMKRIKRLDQEESLRIQREHELAVKKADLENEIKRFESIERVHMEFDLKRMEQLGKMGTEALIAASPVEQGRILADLKKEAAFKDMSADQILALAAKDSPEVARALAEKFKAVEEGKLGERERELYVKMGAEKDANTRAIAEAMDKAAARAKETAEHAMDSLSNLGQAFARGQSGTPVIITAPGGSQTVIPAGAGSFNSAQPERGTKTCPGCGQHVEVEARFCPHCSHQFKGVG